MRAKAVWGALPLSPMGEHMQGHGLTGLRLAGVGQALSASPKASSLRHHACELLRGVSWSTEVSVYSSLAT